MEKETFVKYFCRNENIHKISFGYGKFYIISFGNENTYKVGYGYGYGKHIIIIMGIRIPIVFFLGTGIPIKRVMKLITPIKLVKKIKH